MVTRSRYQVIQLCRTRDLSIMEVYKPSNLTSWLLQTGQNCVVTTPFTATYHDPCGSFHPSSRRHPCGCPVPKRARLRRARDNCASRLRYRCFCGRFHHGLVRRLDGRSNQLPRLWWPGILRQRFLRQLSHPGCSRRREPGQRLQLQVPQHGPRVGGVLAGWSNHGRCLLWRWRHQRGEPSSPHISQILFIST
jgi:hypothetical protein